MYIQISSFRIIDQILFMVKYIKWLKQASHPMGGIDAKMEQAEESPKTSS